MKFRQFIYLLAILLPLFTQGFIILAYGQSGCEGANWGSPLEGEPAVNSPFNPPSHYGTDYKAADGTSVFPVTDGKVEWTDYQVKPLDKPDPRSGQMISGWGRYVVIKHPDGSTTLYAHLMEGSTNHLSVGIPVTKDTIIGEADSTGGVSGSHLHLEYAPDGRWPRKASLKDPNPCIVCSYQEPATVTISGPDAPTDGSQYTATGGTEPYTWSITKGSINSSTGVVTVSGQCGTATITVKDSCGNTGAKDVRMPSGRWILVSAEGGAAGAWADRCDVISGAFKTHYEMVQCCHDIGASHTCQDCIALYDNCPSCSIYLRTPISPPCVIPDRCASQGLERFCTLLMYRANYEWQCP